ncbi:MAG: UDP-N-acetylmuramoyl-tripeptide--D-alanyl-D-alanine ligase [Armatimonadetes bacterium]|nr:UDP-N-acetylmuramoyl-tripeptide--D-alanyl-D-alanine ligase [Armatimonadota bacterium]
MTLGELAQRLGGQLVGVAGNQEFRHFATDNRQIQQGDVFLCIAGANVDGHNFAESAMAAGASACIAERTVNAPHIFVENLVDALGNFGRSLRRDFDGPVIGLTGSHGKTTTKEFVAAALSPLGPVLKNEGNRNSEYTSPLLWHDRVPGMKSAVVEMGMRGFDQITHLAKVHEPNIGLITVIGTAHIEKVGSREGISKAKAELFDALPCDGTAIFWHEDDYARDLRSHVKGRGLTFGFSPEADSQVLGYRMLGWTACQIRGRVGSETYEVELPVTGRHQALNVASAILTAHVAGVSVSDAAAALPTAHIPPLRMEVRKWNGATILVDTYNASPDSTIAALKTLLEGEASGRRLAILGEMKELGDFTEAGHRMVGKALVGTDLDHVFFTGGAMDIAAETALAGGFPASRMIRRPSVNLDEIREFLSSVCEGDVVLIKGSRALGLEKALG